MNVTKKMLAEEKAERANARSQKIMSSFFTRSTIDDEAHNRKYSFENASTPERKKKKKRKPLSPKVNTDPALVKSSRDRVESQKSHSDDKASPKCRSDGGTVRPESRFRYDKHNETAKHSSLKRKRSGLISKKAKQIESAPRKSQESISKYFSKNSHSRKIILGDFVQHVEEIEVKKRSADLNEYLALENEQNQAVKSVKNKMKSAVERQPSEKDASGQVSIASKKDWNERRAKFRSKQPSTGLRSWLKPPGKGGLEASSGGTPTKVVHRHKQRNFTPEMTEKRATASPKMNRKTGLNFMNSGDASHLATDAKDDKQASKQGNHSSQKRALDEAAAIAVSSFESRFETKQIGMDLCFSALGVVCIALLFVQHGTSASLCSRSFSKTESSVVDLPDANSVAQAN
ncbi:unnamed protein product [Phytophthora fragariaefolia]|uniref:Unnamed protein product n=1 Tax=Phytophthora fragariaefolia TaxID=1490495 RepID=A0A9W7D076_9STRA|nr:unnamed protein product [Phytophthora fragariaefolia]